MQGTCVVSKYSSVGCRVEWNISGWPDCVFHFSDSRKVADSALLALILKGMLRLNLRHTNKYTVYRILINPTVMNPVSVEWQSRDATCTQNHQTQYEDMLYSLVLSSTSQTSHLWKWKIFSSACAADTFRCILHFWTLRRNLHRFQQRFPWKGALTEQIWDALPTKSYHVHRSLSASFQSNSTFPVRALICIQSTQANVDSSQNHKFGWLCNFLQRPHAANKEIDLEECPNDRAD